MWRMQVKFSLVSQRRWVNEFAFCALLCVVPGLVHTVVIYHESCKFSEPLSSELWSLRKARKINSFSTPQDISKAREICESIKDTKLKDKCLEEQNLISFIPPIMQEIPWHASQLSLFYYHFEPWLPLTHRKFYDLSLRSQEFSKIKAPWHQGSCFWQWTT